MTPDTTAPAELSPICPYCGDQVVDSADLLFKDCESEVMTACSSCDAIVRVTRRQLTTYTASKVTNEPRS